MKTTIEKIKEHFESGQSLTKLQCIEKFRYINLGDVVYKLRKRGMNIQKHWKYTIEDKKYAIYFMKQENGNKLFD